MVLIKKNKAEGLKCPNIKTYKAFNSGPLSLYPPYSALSSQHPADICKEVYMGF